MRVSARSGIRAPSWVLGQLEPERSTAASAVLETDAAVHQLDHPLADGEPEPGAALLARSGRVRLREAAENAAAELLGDPRTAVVHADADARAALFERDLDLAPLGRELRRIGEQVGHHLKQPLAVDVHFTPGQLAARLEAHLEALAEALVEDDRLAHQAVDR